MSAPHFFLLKYILKNKEQTMFISSFTPPVYMSNFIFVFPYLWLSKSINGFFFAYLFGSPLLKLQKCPSSTLTHVNSSTLATWCEELTHLKISWCWERLRAGGEGDDRGWDGWMASLTRWAWVWVNSRSWWWTGRPGVLRFTWSQRVRHDWATELNWTDVVNNVLNTKNKNWLN